MSLFEAIVKAGDKERQRIGQEIHDGLQQTLISSLLNFKEIKRELKKLSPIARERFNVGFRLLDSGINEARTLSHLYMPNRIVKSGLGPSLMKLADNLRLSIDINILNNLGNERLEPTIELGLYRITQEALSNIIRHSFATTIQIEIRRHRKVIILKVEDNGIGFNVSESTKDGLGLFSMKKRAEAIGGEFNIESNKMGTKVLVEIREYEKEL